MMLQAISGLKLSLIFEQISQNIFPVVVVDINVLSIYVSGGGTINERAGVVVDLRSTRIHGPVIADLVGRRLVVKLIFSWDVAEDRYVLTLV